MNLELFVHNRRRKNKARQFYSICRVLLLFLISPACSFSQKLSERIKLNQSGFYPNGPKMAVLTGSDSSTDFYITSTNLRDTVFSGKLSDEKQSPYSSTKTRIANFS